MHNVIAKILIFFENYYFFQQFSSDIFVKENKNSKYLKFSLQNINAWTTTQKLLPQNALHVPHVRIKTSFTLTKMSLENCWKI